MSVVSAAEQIVDLFRKRPVLRMSEIERAVGPRSQRSLFRDLTSVGYLSSYTHTGRCYTPQSIPRNSSSDGRCRHRARRQRSMSRCCSM